MSIQVTVILTDDGVMYDDDDGTLIPVPCQWFAKCDNVAMMTMSHPVLGDVPICTRCNDKVERMNR